MRRRPTTRSTAANSAASATVFANDPKSTLVPRIGPRRSESANQPTRSSIIAAAITSKPTSDLNSPRSRSVFAMTGSAEMLSATPSSSAKVARREGSTRSDSGSTNPRTTPLAIGSRTPSRPVASALRPRRRSTPRSTSSPTTTSKSTTATVVYALIVQVGAPGGNSHACCFGAMRPSAVGPSAIPAAISPTTSGRPIARASSPQSLAEASSAPSASRKTRTSWSVIRASSASREVLGAS
jgi:hypothetical protein